VECVLHLLDCKSDISGSVIPLIPTGFMRFCTLGVFFYDEIIPLSKILQFFHFFLYYLTKMSYTLIGLGHMIDFWTVSDRSLFIMC